MEEKWLGERSEITSSYNPESETKKMRDLIDRLEDRPYLGLLRQRQ